MSIVADEHGGKIVEIVDGDVLDAVQVPGLILVGAGVHAEEHVQHGHNTHEREHVEHGREQVEHQ